ncbi:MAG: hypothetical protein HYZ47_01315 [Simkania negevensis]|nr:hypothetical protein [Simkania negevensis]
MPSDRQIIDNGSDETSFWKVTRKLASDFFSILLILLVGSGVGFFERICMARSSLEMLQGVVQAMCALQVFQLSS